MYPRMNSFETSWSCQQQEKRKRRKKKNDAKCNMGLRKVGRARQYKGSIEMTLRSFFYFWHPLLQQPTRIRKMWNLISAMQGRPLHPEASVVNRRICSSSFIHGAARTILIGSAPAGKWCHSHDPSYLRTHALSLTLILIITPLPPISTRTQSLVTFAAIFLLNSKSR
jgi:hypothetical protein